jgi:hypothetical protein
MQKPSRLMAALEIIEKENQKHPLTLGTLVTLLGEMGHGILRLLLCVFFLQPIPLPGVSTPVGVVIIVLSVFQFLNWPPWIPKRFQNRSVPQNAMDRVIKVSEKIWGHLERFLRPRMMFLTQFWSFRLLNLCVILSSSLLLLLPLPIPFTNTVPAIVIIALSLAQLEEDGLLVLFSYLMAIAMLIFFYSLGNGVLQFIQRPWASSF